MSVEDSQWIHFGLSGPWNIFLNLIVDQDSVREVAVTNVDQRHGYTVEFAPDPDYHKYEYDQEEERLRKHATN